MAATESKTKENLLCHLQIDESDSTMSNHMAGLVGEILQTNPKDAFGNLEKISAFLKNYRFHPTPAPDTTVPTPFAQQHLNAIEALQRSKIPYTGETEISNFSDDAAMLHWAGISFGDQQNYDITVRIRALAQGLGNNLTKIRFWGKLLGTTYDYWIAEGQLIPSTVDIASDIEPRGKGANSYSYWALSSKPGSDWELLPNVRPSWISTSRLLRKYLTGDLDAQVSGFVHFPERERGYLRAVIARIGSSCILAPTGAFIAGEEEGTIQENAEFEFPAIDDLKNQSSWVHAREHLLKNGKTKYPEVDPEDEEQAKLVEQQKESDPVVGALRSIENDAPAGEEGSSKGWHTSQVGDPASYTFDSLQKSYAVSVVRSLRWPGAYSVCQGKRYCNIYVGYGLRNEGSCFFPLAPGDVQTEPKDDVDEQKEPNPLKEVMSDQGSEDERVEGEENE